MLNDNNTLDEDLIFDVVGRSAKEVDDVEGIVPLHFGRETSVDLDRRGLEPEKQAALKKGVKCSFPFFSFCGNAPALHCTQP